MEPVDIQALQEYQIDEAIEVFLDSFRTEAFTRSWLDLGRPGTRRSYGTLVHILAHLSLEAAYPLYAAVHEGSLAGLALVETPGRNLSPWKVLKRAVGHLPTLLPLVGHLLRASHLPRLLRPPKSLPEHHFTLQIIAVHPEHQGKGVGRALMNQIDSLLQEDDRASGIYLVTGDTRNREIYEKAGYRTLETRSARDLTAHHMFRDRPRSQVGR